MAYAGARVLLVAAAQTLRRRHPMRELCERITAKKGDAARRFVLCILLVALPPSFAFAAKEPMSERRRRGRGRRRDDNRSPDLFERMRQPGPRQGAMH
jgi:hypothetical protein